MSDLVPDFIPKTLDGRYFIESKNTTITHEIPEKKVFFPKEDLLAKIDEYVARLEGDAERYYKFAKLSATTNPAKQDSTHIFKLFKIFFIASLKHTFPNRDTKEIEESLENVKKILDKFLEDGNIENTMYIHCLLGMMRGLL
jgi:hypothetical protein